MKIRLSLTLLFVILGFQNVFAQTQSQIAGIRTEVAAINKNISKYKLAKKNVDEISLEGTEATFYSAKRNLKKIAAKIYGETYNAVVDIYYEGDKPIFIYQRLNKYDKPFNLSPKTVEIEETRVYLINEKIVKLLVGKKELKFADQKFNEIKADFDELSRKLFKAFKE